MGVERSGGGGRELGWGRLAHCRQPHAVAAAVLTISLTLTLTLTLNLSLTLTLTLTLTPNVPPASPT